MKSTRNRFIYLIFILAVILMGLASRRYAAYLPYWLGNYAGDALWALMVFLIIGFCFKALKTSRVTIYALIFSFAIETSQLYHAPWIDVIRRTTIGGLILGFGFQCSDLLCYTIGILIGAILELLYSYK